MIVHCNVSFRPEFIWFLIDTEDFTNRRLEVGICPVCEHKLARLVETRITDNVTFETLRTRRKANRLINSLKDEIHFTNLDCMNKNKTLYGWRYGETKEVIKKDGTKTITEKAVDFYGHKTIIKEEIHKI